jgi:hypothetical protein
LEGMGIAGKPVAGLPRRGWLSISTAFEAMSYLIEEESKVKRKEEICTGSVLAFKPLEQCFKVDPHFLKRGKKIRGR